MIETVNTRSSWKYYKENSTSARKYTITDFCKVLSLFMEKLVIRLKEDGRVNLPDAMGVIQITGKKVKPTVIDGEVKGLAPNWKLTKEMWAKYPELKEKKELFYHTNENTNGVRYRVEWNTDAVLVQNKFYYTFVTARHLKREISALITNGKEYHIKS